VILLISASRIARITGIEPGWRVNLNKRLKCKKKKNQKPKI
jgi:ABC-type proline/glycine betaine transport system substrate-binding protein